MLATNAATRAAIAAEGTMTIKALPKLTPIGSNVRYKAAVAAEIGEAVMASCDATTAELSG